MAEAPIAAMKAGAERLDRLGLKYAFLGGSVVGLLLDHPSFSQVQVNDDVDVVIEVVSRRDMPESRRSGAPSGSTMICGTLHRDADGGSEA